MRVVKVKKKLRKKKVLVIKKVCNYQYYNNITIQKE